MNDLTQRGPMGQRVQPFKSKAWRDSARGQECQLQIPGVCNHDPRTTVLCHLRMFGWAGMAEKPPDFLAVYACEACHSILDRRGTKADIDPWDILRALGNTLIIHHREGRL